MSASIESLVKEIVSLADQKKAFDIRVYQPHDNSLTDFIIVASVQNPIHAKSMIRDIEGGIKDYLSTHSGNAFHPHPKQSGSSESGWMILDENSVIVHVVSEIVRETYQLDQLFEQRAVIYHI